MQASAGTLDAGKDKEGAGKDGAAEGDNGGDGGGDDGASQASASKGGRKPSMASIVKVCVLVHVSLQLCL